MTKEKYKQTEITKMTEIGTVRFLYSFELVNDKYVLDALFISVNDKDIAYPKAWAYQTTTTIVKKLCAMGKAA